MSKTSPYAKGPLKRGELPRLVFGTGILIFGTWGLTRWLVEKAKREQAAKGLASK